MKIKSATFLFFGLVFLNVKSVYADVVIPNQPTVPYDNPYRPISNTSYLPYILLLVSIALFIAAVIYLVLIKNKT